MQIIKYILLVLISLTTLNIAKSQTVVTNVDNIEDLVIWTLKIDDSHLPGMAGVGTMQYQEVEFGPNHKVTLFYVTGWVQRYEIHTNNLIISWETREVIYTYEQNSNINWEDSSKGIIKHIFENNFSAQIYNKVDEKKYRYHTHHKLPEINFEGKNLCKEETGGKMTIECSNLYQEINETILKIQKYYGIRNL